MRGETLAEDAGQPIHKFQSTPLMRGETVNSAYGYRIFQFQSTPLMRGETIADPILSMQTNISIHSPHARGDLQAEIKQRTHSISIHSPHARGDVSPTLCRLTTANFNPLPSCEGRPFTTPPKNLMVSISIHSPHARGDSINFQKIHRIQGSLYNTIHFTRFCEFFQPV